MPVEQQVLRRIDELLALGDRVLSTRRSPSPGHITDDFVDVQLATQWLVSSQALLQTVFGKESAHYQRLQSHAVKYPQWADVRQAYGVLLAAKDDISNGILASMRTLIQAEVFDDLLEQAAHLYDAGYIGPAAVLAGSVLEDSLRKLCEREGITLAPKPKLDTLNSALAKKGVYSLLVQKKVTALADVRNNAAHGNQQAFTAADVDSMIRDVRSLVTTHLG